MADVDKATSWYAACGPTARTTRPTRRRRELPKKVNKPKDQGLLDRIGLDDDLLDKIPGGLGSKLKDIL